MSVIVEEDVVTDNIFDLDFSYAPKCELEVVSGNEDCDEQATHKMVLSCCAEVWLLCEDHMFEILEFLKNSVMPQHNPDEGGCGAAPIKIALIERL